MRPVLFKSDGSGEGFGFIQHTERSIWCAREPCLGWWKAMRLHTSINEGNAEITEETSNVKTTIENVLLNCRANFSFCLPVLGAYTRSDCMCLQVRLNNLCTHTKAMRTWQLTWSWSQKVSNVRQQGQPLVFLLATCVHPLDQPKTKQKKKEKKGVYKKVLLTVTSLTAWEEIMKRWGKLWKAALASNSLLQKISLAFPLMHTHLILSSRVILPPLTEPPSTLRFHIYPAFCLGDKSSETGREQEHQLAVTHGRKWSIFKP